MIIRSLFLITLAFSMSGCASVSHFLAEVEAKIAQSIKVDDDVRMTYEDIMDTRTIRNTPGDGYRWIRPVVQKLEVPNMIRGGVFIPKHEEYVIVNDAAYVMADEMSDAVRSKYGIPSGVEMVSPLKGSEVVVGVFRMNRVFAESTVVPIGKVSFLFQGKSMDRVLALRNNEVAQVGNFLLTFEREKRDEFITAGIAEDGLKSVRTYSLTRSQVLFLSNGYVILPMFEISNRRGES